MKRFLKPLLIFIVPFLFLFVFLSSKWMAPKPSGLDALRNSLNSLANSEQLDQGMLGFCLSDPRSGQILLEFNAGKTLIPASNMKIVSSIPALATLGEMHRFKTVLQYDGSIENGVLKGNIYIRGGGDPTLGSSKPPGVISLENFVAECTRLIKQLGIQKIDGSVIGDAQIFENQMLHSNWDWGDVGNYYGAGPSGLSIHDNLYHLYFSSGPREGDATRVLKTEPYIPDIEFYNDVTSGKKGSGDNAYIFGGEYSSLRYIRGTITPNRKRFKIKGAIPDPAYFLAYELSKNLTFSQVEVVQPPSTIRRLKKHGGKYSFNRQDVQVFQSNTLQEILKEVNQESNNLYAEHLMKYLGFVLMGEGSYDKGVDAVKKFWGGKGFDLDGLFMDDASGLSRNNAIPAKLMVGFLDHATREPWFNAFKESLAVCGESGTMEGMCQKSSASGRIFAKSGTISKVKAYSGYVETRSGKLLSFSLITNQFTGRSSQMTKRLEKIMIQLSQLN